MSHSEQRAKRRAAREHARSGKQSRGAPMFFLDATAVSEASGHGSGVGVAGFSLRPSGGRAGAAPRDAQPNPEQARSGAVASHGTPRERYGASLGAGYGAAPVQRRGPSGTFVHASDRPAVEPRLTLAAATVCVNPLCLPPPVVNLGSTRATGYTDSTPRDYSYRPDGLSSGSELRPAHSDAGNVTRRPFSAKRERWDSAAKPPLRSRPALLGGRGQGSKKGAADEAKASGRPRGATAGGLGGRTAADNANRQRGHSLVGSLAELQRVVGSTQPGRSSGERAGVPPWAPRTGRSTDAASDGHMTHGSFSGNRPLDGAAADEDEKDDTSRGSSTSRSGPGNMASVQPAPSESGWYTVPSARQAADEHKALEIAGVRPSRRPSTISIDSSSSTEVFGGERAGEQDDNDSAPRRHDSPSNRAESWTQPARPTLSLSQGVGLHRRTGPFDALSSTKPQGSPTFAKERRLSWPSPVDERGSSSDRTDSARSSGDSKSSGFEEAPTRVGDAAWAASRDSDDGRRGESREELAVTARERAVSPIVVRPPSVSVTVEDHRKRIVVSLPLMAPGSASPTTGDDTLDLTGAVAERREYRPPARQPGGGRDRVGQLRASRRPASAPIRGRADDIDVSAGARAGQSMAGLRTTGLGMATGGVHASVRPARHRPTTAQPARAGQRDGASYSPQSSGDDADNGHVKDSRGRAQERPRHRPLHAVQPGSHRPRSGSLSTGASVADHYVQFLESARKVNSELQIVRQSMAAAAVAQPPKRRTVRRRRRKKKPVVEARVSTGQRKPRRAPRKRTQSQVSGPVEAADNGGAGESHAGVRAGDKSPPARASSASGSEESDSASDDGGDDSGAEVTAEDSADVDEDGTEGADSDAQERR